MKPPVSQTESIGQGGKVVRTGNDLKSSLQFILEYVDRELMNSEFEVER